jgi:hypothetical protein
MRVPQEVRAAAIERAEAKLPTVGTLEIDAGALYLLAAEAAFPGVFIAFPGPRPRY